MAKVMQSVPILPCLNWEETIGFYDKLNFKVEHFYPDNNYLILQRDGVQLHFWKSTDRKLAEASGCYIRCDDPDPLQAEFAARGVKCAPPENRSWGQREFHIRF
jgi:hypothetical protein